MGNVYVSVAVEWSEPEIWVKHGWIFWLYEFSLSFHIGLFYFA